MPNPINMELISSLQNEKIKNIVKLRETSRERKKQALFLIEGRREISLAAKAGVEIENIFYCFDYAKGKNKIGAEKIIDVSKNVFDKISYRENPDGFLAVAEFVELKLENVKLSHNPLIIILEAVEKPGNLGAILRTSDAAGVDAVIVNDLKTDIYNPNVIRASQGAVFTVPVVLSSFEKTAEFCEKNKIKTFAAAPAAKKQYIEMNYSRGCAVVMGAEDKGLSEKWIKSADENIKIKMSGKIDSLNVSVSAAIILFEILRQRAN